jgi:hypothetical protein
LQALLNRARQRRTNPRKIPAGLYGRICRNKEDAERQMADAVAKTTAAKALTDRALRLEADMRPIQDRLRMAGPIVEANVQGGAIAKLFRRPDAEAEFAATVQQFALAGVVEALIVLSMVSFELLGRNHAHPSASIGARGTVLTRLLRSWRGRRRPAVEAHVPAIVPEKPNDGRVIKLVAARSATRTSSSSIPKILTAALEPAAGQRVDIAEVYRRYALDCAMAGHASVSPEQFADPLKRFCKGTGIQTKMEGEHVYLLNVQIGHVARYNVRHVSRRFAPWLAQQSMVQAEKCRAPEKVGRAILGYRDSSTSRGVAHGALWTALVRAQTAYAVVDGKTIAGPQGCPPKAIRQRRK